jgi:hypothetical protein
LFFAKGLGFTAIPKPVKLTHYLSEPLHPPANSKDPEVFADRVDQFHAQIVRRMEVLMSETAKEHE